VGQSMEKRIAVPVPSSAKFRGSQRSALRRPCLRASASGVSSFGGPRLSFLCLHPA
jgi:hypothetical protein